jgi:2-oxoglutarate dehydrogenase E2 component (dihydrolipoamide succinyltransferase)
MVQALILLNMARFELILPAMGEGIIEAAITRWLVSSGQHVEIDQPLVEVATDKVDSEIPSPVKGTVVRLIYHEGEIPKVGEVIALLETEYPEEKQQKADIVVPDVKKLETEVQVLPVREDHPIVLSKATPSPLLNISPLVRFLARQRGITADELRLVIPTGPDGRITKADIDRYIMEGRPGSFVSEPSAVTGELYQQQVQQEPFIDPEDEVVEMDRMRKIIAGHMMKSKRIAPHVTSFLEADITAMVAWRERHKDAFYSREEVRLTFTPLFVEAVAQALKDFPRINVAVSGELIIIRKNINIGFATALPDGNLIVPVIRNADRESLGGLSRKISDMAERARSNSLLPGEIKGGTFTITNIGQYNNLTGTPIINQPESAILAVGTIAKKPWAVKTGSNYGLAIRDITMLSLTYDHRVIDGALGGSFLSRIAWYLENFDTGREL